MVMGRAGHDWARAAAVPASRSAAMRAIRRINRIFRPGNRPLAGHPHDAGVAPATGVGISIARSNCQDSCWTTQGRTFGYELKPSDGEGR
jgi:hypothetical protein